MFINKHFIYLYQHKKKTMVQKKINPMRQAMSDYKFLSSYAKWIPDEKLLEEQKKWEENHSETISFEAHLEINEIIDDGRKETWEEAVERVMNMHRRKYKAELKYSQKLREHIDFVEFFYKKKYILGSMRALQFGGESIEKHNAKMFNCLGGNIDRLKFFGEAMYLLLCGCGVGFSVQKHHIDKLPPLIKELPLNPKNVQIEDSIEGWANSIQYLIDSYLNVDSEYYGYKLKFDYTLIRPKGSMIAGGFKAPGPNGLNNSIEKVRKILNDCVSNGYDKIKPINAYDIMMHCSDAVLSGGVRRSATIVLFSQDDDEMMKCKTGNWFLKTENPQRARSNNSVVLDRNNIEFEAFNDIFENIKQFGEPAFYFADHKDQVTNPCLTDDNSILTSNGLKTIKELINVPYVAVVNGKEYDCKDGFVYTGTKNIYEIHLVNGNVIKGTGNHKLMTENGYIQINELSLDDNLEMNANDDISLKTYTQIKKVINLNLEAPVYDCRVEDIHQFVVNGVISSNCVEISFAPFDDDGNSGFQGCNLCEINGSLMETEELFYDACRAAAIMGTFQAGYTDFKYLSEVSKNIFEGEALLGISITGMMNKPDICFDQKIQAKGAKLIKEVNREIAQLININPAARTTCIKPSGNASVLLGCASGIHGEYAPEYIRNVQVNLEELEGQILNERNPLMIEQSVYSANNTDNVISFPITSPKGSIYKKDLFGVKQLEYVKSTQINWVMEGSDDSLCRIKGINHNVSNTISVNNWDEVALYIYENREFFTGVSMLSATGDRDYEQAPFTEIINEKYLGKEYGVGAFFASGLIVNGLKAFDSLWKACGDLLGQGEKLKYSYEEVQEMIDSTTIEQCWKNLYPNDNKVVRALVKTKEKPSVDDYLNFANDKIAKNITNYGDKVDWLRQAEKFSRNYFNGDNRKMTYCLKDVHNLHRKNKIEMDYTEVNWSEEKLKPTYTEIDTLGAIACAGGKCEI